ncbi:MAG: aspartate aminotransferase family protein, partial [Deltaproteobacteria bacterium]
MPREAIFEELRRRRSEDVDWREGKTFGYIYDAGKEIEEVAKMAYTTFLSDNALDPTVFPSLMGFENEIVAMIRAHLGGDEEVVGNFTSGGTESILLAVKSARDFAREERGIEHPEMILPVTAHAAFHKAAHYFGVKPVIVPVDPQTFKADVAAMRAAVTPRTALLVASAPSYAHGVVDPVREIGTLALEKDLWLHVDACIGGFLLPYFRRLGEEIPDFDFSVPGVTSLSVDLHKYAYAAKGASVILYRNKALRRYQLFTCSSWAGYTMINPTIQSTRSGGPMAAAWAVLNFVGDAGYLEIARALLRGTEEIVAGIGTIPDLEILGKPEMTLIAVASERVSVFHVIDEMKALGWYIQPQLRCGALPENFHLLIQPSNLPWTKRLIEDLAEATARARQLPRSEVAATIGEQFREISPESLTDEMFEQMLQAAGIEGTTLPERMAEINEIL